MYKNLILAFCICLFSLSCSKSVKGPITGHKYKVNVGGWSDMDKYKEAREQAKSQENEVERPQDCNIVDCPDKIKKGY